MKKVFAVTLLGLFVTGCQHTGPGRTAKPQPICQAMVGPIKYNSQNIKSRRHAGPDLAADLRVRNRVGVNLGCPAYR